VSLQTNIYFYFRYNFWSVDFGCIICYSYSLSQYFCGGSFVFLHINYFQHSAIFQLLLSCVFPLCVIAFTYTMTARRLLECSKPISEETQSSQTQQTEKYCKSCVGTYCCFSNQLCVFSHILNIFVFQHTFGNLCC